MAEDLDDLVAALRPVKTAFEELGVKYFVGGSVASSYHGATRSTMDVDLVAELCLEQVEAFVAKVTCDYYASESAVRSAVERRSCFNLIHNATSFKVDVFISRERSFDVDSFARASDGEIGSRQKLIVPFASAEDIIVSKLEWYQLGNETSQRQWDDINRVYQLLGESADHDYLDAAAESVGVSKLWLRLKDEFE